MHGTLEESGGVCMFATLFVRSYRVEELVSVNNLNAALAFRAK